MSRRAETISDILVIFGVVTIGAVNQASARPTAPLQRGAMNGDVVYQTMVDVLNAPVGDEFQIVLTEVARENWSFGNGEAQYT